MPQSVGRISQCSPVCSVAVLAASIFSKLNSRELVIIRVRSRLAFSPCSAVSLCLRGRFWLRLFGNLSAFGNELQRNPSSSYALAYSFGAAAGAQLSQDGADMKFHGVLRNVQLCGNFFIAQSFAHQPQDLVFTRGQGFNQ